MNVHSQKSNETGAPTLGERLRSFRRGAGWTLKEMSVRSGIPFSTLSKIEHGQLSLRYEQLQSLVVRLGLRPADLFFETTPLASSAGRRSITRRDALTFEADGELEYAFPCADLRQKHMTPMLVRMHRAKQFAPNASAVQGQDHFLYVLENAVEVATQLYSPVVLVAGDSLYVDSKMAPVTMSPTVTRMPWPCWCARIIRRTCRAGAARRHEIIGRRHVVSVT